LKRLEVSVPRTEMVKIREYSVCVTVFFSFFFL